MRRKNKEVEQRVDRDFQKEERRRQQNKPIRKQIFKDPIPTILIVCEGENTEPSYFEKFKVKTATIEIEGTGCNCVSLVEEALRLHKLKIYDQTWVVFDADPKPSNPKQAINFNDAVALAEKNGFGVAYSHQAFEYWLILHFNDHQGGKIQRSRYNNMLNKYLSPFNIVYDGNGDKLIKEEFFELLRGKDSGATKTREELAIKRATRNFKAKSHLIPAKQESISTVFRLVEELRKYAN